MRKHSFLRGLTAFTLAGLLAFYSGVVQLPNVSAESITDLKSQLAELEKQEEENNKRLEELRDDVSQKRAYRDELQGKIDIIQQQLDILVQRINELDAQIEQGEQDIADTRISINANYTKLKKRLRALYMAGEASNLSILLSSTSLVDYTQKSEVIQSVTKHDTELLDTLEEQLTSIQEQVEKINADKEELSTDKKDLDSKSDELSALYLENQKLLDEAEQNEAEAQAEAERLEKEKEEADAAIDKWYEDYYAALKAQARTPAALTTAVSDISARAALCGRCRVTPTSPAITATAATAASTLRAAASTVSPSLRQTAAKSFTAIGWTATATACSLTTATAIPRATRMPAPLRALWVIPSPPAKRSPTWALRAILRARTFTLKLFTTAAPRTRSITFNITLL